MADLEGLKTAVEIGDREAAVEITTQAIAEEIPPKEVLDWMTDAMGVVGGRFQEGEIFVPEMLISARAMKAAVALLEPLLIGAGFRPDSVAVIGTIKGDLHDIGKNLVAMMWKGANIDVIDLGTNTSAEKFLAAAREHDADIVGISALLTTTMGGMRTVVDAVKSSERSFMRVIVGGAPVTPEFAAQVGADGYAPDAASAVPIARKLVAESRALRQEAGVAAKAS
jgi:methylmalonyl-CoA mutase cobalamin-binding domain/chain